MARTDNGRIEGRVVAVLSERELVLNVGSDDGVEIGMKFVILNSKGINLTDPVTGEDLGTVEVPKTLVKVVRLTGSRLSVGRTFRTVKGSRGLFSSVSGITGTPDRPETLDIES